MTVNQSIMDLANKAAQMEDQTETKSGGDFEYKLPEAGKTIGRLIEYIELGPQKQAPYQGKPKPDAEKVRLTFELLHPKKNFTTIQTDDGEKTFTDTISLEVKKSLSGKANFKKLFNKMLYGRDGISHMAQMLGDGFILGVHHNKSQDGKKEYANLHPASDDGAADYDVSAPVIVDPLEGTSKPINIPANTRPLRIFLWDNPTKETWDSLFIDGTRDVKDDKGNVTKVSKNWLQERIMGSPAFEGSALHQMLAGLNELPTTEAEVDPLSGKPVQTADTSTNPVGSTTASPSEAALAQTNKPTATASADDLADLGL